MKKYTPPVSTVFELQNEAIIAASRAIEESFNINQQEAAYETLSNRRTIWDDWYEK